MPSIACTIVSDPKDDGLRFWEYTPLREGDTEKLSSWIDGSLTVRRGAIDTEAFIAEMNQRRTPYVHADGCEQHIHFYLLIDDASSGAGTVPAALFLHGGHILLDARPALRCLNLLFDWIVKKPAELAEATWGTEWKRLPAGPLIATGGPSDDFDTKGLELLQHAAGLMMDTTVSHFRNTDLCPTNYSCHFVASRSSRPYLSLHLVPRSLIQEGSPESNNPSMHRHPRESYRRARRLGSRCSTSSTLRSSYMSSRESSLMD